MDSEEIKHVRFQEDDGATASIKTSSNKIIVELLSSSELKVLLGFLQIYHIYEIKISILKSLIPFMSPCNIQEIHSAIVSGPCVKILQISDENEQNWEMILHLKTRRERLLKESFKLQLGSQKMDIILYARVLGRGKGTPSLKDGIQSILVEVDEESEISDWKGFE